ncbi:hypothetical protein Tco_1170291 [Tanacetum coccineum]
MSTPTFADTHNLVAFLEKPIESAGFEEIVDFLNASHIKYALTVNPTIYTSCIQQLWATAEAKTVNDELHIHALVDKKKVIITEKSVRSDLHLEDAEGRDYLPNATIFEELTRMGYEKLSQKLTFYKAFFSPQWKFLIHAILQCLSAKTTAWNEFSSTMASAIICLATNQKFNFSKYIFDNMMKNLEGRVKFLMYPREGKGFSGNITPLFETMMVQDPKEVGEGSNIPTDPHHTPTTTQPSISKPQKKQSRRKQRKDTKVSQPSGPTEPGADETENVKVYLHIPMIHFSVIDSLKRRVKKLEKKASKITHKLKRMYKVGLITLVDETLERYDADEDIYQVNVPRDEDMFGVYDLGSEEVVVEHVDTSGGKKVKQSEQVAGKEVSTDDQVTTAGEVVTTASVEVTTVNATTTTVDELTLAQTLMEIKASKPKAVTTAATKFTPASTRPRAKGIFFHGQEEQAPASTPIVSSS